MGLLYRILFLPFLGSKALKYPRVYLDPCCRLPFACRSRRSRPTPISNAERGGRDFGAAVSDPAAAVDDDDGSAAASESVIVQQQLYGELHDAPPHPSLHAGHGGGAVKIQGRRDHGGKLAGGNLFSNAGFFVEIRLRTQLGGGSFHGVSITCKLWQN